MSINRIIEQVENNLKNMDLSAETLETGSVVSVQDGIAKISGLKSVMSSEIVLIGKDKVKALVLNLEEDAVGAVVLDNFKTVKEGDEVRRSEALLSINVSESILGRVVSAMGVAVDGEGETAKGKSYPVERIAPGVMQREPVNVPMQTGVKAIDGMIPVGRGQRELIIGDRQTGKTTIAIDTIINQKGKDILDRKSVV